MKPNIELSLLSPLSLLVLFYSGSPGLPVGFGAGLSFVCGVFAAGLLVFAGVDPGFGDAVGNGGVWTLAFAAVVFGDGDGFNNGFSADGVNVGQGISLPVAISRQASSKPGIN